MKNKNMILDLIATVYAIGVITVSIFEDVSMDFYFQSLITLGIAIIFNQWRILRKVNKE